MRVTQAYLQSSLQSTLHCFTRRAPRLALAAGAVCVALAAGGCASNPTLGEKSNEVKEAAHHAGQRVLGHQHRQAGFFHQQAVQVAQQGAASTRDWALERYRIAISLRASPVFRALSMVSTT